MNQRTVKNAVVVEFQKRRKPSKHYVYVINVTWSDNSVVVIFRRYSKFFELQTKLFEDFPEEGGVKDPSKRSLPFLPGKIIFGRSNTRDVAEKRKEPINEYCQSLIKLPGKISESELVLFFFEPTNEDISPGEGEDQKDKKKAKDEIAQVISEPMQLDQYIVIADYKKQNRGEVSVLAGDIVEVIDKNENGWWFVNMDEEQGWLPASYLEPEDGSAESAISTTYKVGEERYIAAAPYSAIEPDELGFQKGVVVDVMQKNVDGWWLIRFNNKEGWAPAIHLKKLDPSQALPTPHGYENVNLENEPVIPRKPQRQRKENEGNQSSKPPPPRKGSVRKSHKVKNRVRTPPGLHGKGNASISSLNEAEYVALSEYRAGGKSGRLSVQEGASVQIIEKSPNGWWFCKIGNEEGWIPSSHLNRQEKRSLKLPVAPTANSPAVKPRPTTSEVEYVAISDYTDDDQLNISLKKDVAVKVLEKNDSGWWYVESRGAEGWAPSTYLEERPKQKPKPPPKVNVSRAAPRPQGTRQPPARPSPPGRPKNPRTGQLNDGGKLVPPIPNRVNKPSLKENTKGPSRTNVRTSGSVENLLEKFQAKPAVALKQARSAENLLSGGHEGRRGREGQRRVAIGYYVAIADYSDDEEETLNMNKGDRIEVLQRDEGGWWRARLGNKTGWVPSNYLEFEM